MHQEISSPPLSAAAWVSSTLSLVATTSINSVAGCFYCAYNTDNEPMRSAPGVSMWGPVLNLAHLPNGHIGDLIKTADSYPKMKGDNIVTSPVVLEPGDSDSETDYSVNYDHGVIERDIGKPRDFISKATYDSPADEGLTVAIIKRPTYIRMESIHANSVDRKIRKDLEAGEVAREAVYASTTVAAPAKSVTRQPQHYLTEPLILDSN
ncbi:hypothetical protein ACVBEF_13840 [Glaciimonas sp. GG7]